MGLRWSNGGRRLTLAARQLLAMPTWPANGNASFVFRIWRLGEKTGGKTDHKLDELRNYGERFSTVENFQVPSKSARLASGSEVQARTFGRVFWR